MTLARYRQQAASRPLTEAQRSILRRIRGKWASDDERDQINDLLDEATR